MEEKDTKDVAIRARDVTLAEIELRRLGGAVQATIKSPILHTYIQALAIANAPRVGIAAGITGRIQNGALSGLTYYRAVDSGALRDSCGSASYTADDGTFYALRASSESGYALNRDNAHLISVFPLMGPHLQEGTPFTLAGLWNIRQLRLLCRAWRTFIENIHREHASEVVVGVTIKLEEWFRPILATDGENKEFAPQTRTAR
jgi:hypothetical protein